MIEVKNLSVQTSKGVVLLDHVEFTLTPGVCTGLTGASGSGKTTLLKALMGVSDGDVSINSGQILLDGEDLLKKPEKVRRDLCGTTLGFIPQNPMTAFQSPCASWDTDVRDISETASIRKKCCPQT